MIPEPAPKPDRLALIKKIATKKKRKRGNNTYPNRIIKEGTFHSEIEPTKTTI